MSKILENLIEEITTETTLNAKQVKRMFEEELKTSHGDEEQAAHEVRMRVKYFINII